MRTLTERRKGYYRKNGTRVKKSKPFKIRDRGKPGRGPKLIPMRNAKEQEKHYGRQHPVNALAWRMGYTSATRIPDGEMDAFVRRLVDDYSERSARGMIQSQINFRKDSRSKKVIRDREKFEKMMASLDRQFKGGGWQ